MPSNPALAVVNEPAPTRREWLGLGVLAVGLGLIVLDGTIVGVALPAIISDLGLNLTDAQWVNSLYAVVLAALLLSTGRLADRWGRKRMFLFGLVVFVGGSLLAAAADASGSLIGARAVQAVGAAFIMPSTLSTVNAVFRGRYRAAAFGVWGAVISGAAAIGPLAGGALTQWVSWHWIFLVNLPLGALVLVGAILTVPETRGGDHRPGADVDGALLSAVDSVVTAGISAMDAGRSARGGANDQTRSSSSPGAMAATTCAPAMVATIFARLRMMPASIMSRSMSSGLKDATRFGSNPANTSRNRGRLRRIVIQLSPAWNPSRLIFSNSARSPCSGRPHSSSW